MVTPNPTDTPLRKACPLSNLYFFLLGLERKLTEQWWLPLQVFRASHSALVFWEAQLNSKAF